MTLNNYAKAGKVDSIVVGMHGRSGLENWLLGSVAESVLSHAEVDVLAVPPLRGRLASTARRSRRRSAS